MGNIPSPGTRAWRGQESRRWEGGAQNPKEGVAPSSQTCFLDRRRRAGKVAWATRRAGPWHKLDEGPFRQECRGNKHRTKGPDRRGRLRLPGMSPERLAPSRKAPSRSKGHTSPRCLGVRSGSPGRAGRVRRQQHDLCGSHLAREKAEREAGGWAAGTRGLGCRHAEAAQRYPLPAARPAGGTGPSLALGHQTHSTGDASSEPTQGGGGRQNWEPSGPGKGQLGRSPEAGRAQAGP